MWLRNLSGRVVWSSVTNVKAGVTSTDTVLANQNVPNVLRTMRQEHVQFSLGLNVVTVRGHTLQVPRCAKFSKAKWLSSVLLMMVESKLASVLCSINICGLYPREAA